MDLPQNSLPTLPTTPPIRKSMTEKYSNGDKSRRRLPTKDQSTSSQISRIASQQRTRHLLDYYKVGHRAAKALELPPDDFDDAAPDRHERIEQLAKNAHVEPHWLDDCQRVVRAFSLREYKALIARIEIHWEHIVCLSTVRRSKSGVS